MNVAFIPVRGGSKSIPLKNIKLLNGKPLVYWTIKAACECQYIDKVYVSTDSDDIKMVVESFKQCSDGDCFRKLNVIGRSALTATDTASTESAMLEFAESYDFDNIFLVQATSPLLKASDLCRGFEIFSSKNTDSVLSVVRQKRFCWSVDTLGFASPINYDVFNRPRRQDFQGYLVENGAFYISSKDALIKSRNRVSGKIKTVEMNEDSYFEIDELSDWIIVESLMKKNRHSNLSNLPDIKLFLSDCDGCLTDGGMYYSEKGDELKKFNTRDGMGFSILKERGILTGIVTSENVKLNERRADKLKLDVLKLGSKNKLHDVIDICKKFNVSLNNVCYVGDDINDVMVLKSVGFGCAPADAMPEVKSVAKFITKAKGGDGVIREIVNTLFHDKEK
ncbi:N-acylneuraminate cytidylyltransferase [Segatella bryantii]|uniref:N-acylneuraminate cytidylyltransferase n=1 Tax=Segatella bryantii TaxID=77095 RepID=UPI00242CA825|nr:N-acylneuraminate cytidylyltransferase [Segatella bryantii]